METRNDNRLMTDLTQKLSMENRRVLITGASRGLGSVCAQAFSEIGAKLALMARSADTLENVRKSCRSPKDHISIPCDLTDSAQLHRGVEEAQKFLGGFDTVLHVTGGGLGLRDALISRDDLLALFILNVVVATEINKLVAPGMIHIRKGNLVHVASVAASEGVASVGYNTVKAALSAYVRSLGNELAGSNIIVTGISPGGFLAPGNSWDRLGSMKPEVVNEFIRSRLPRGRLADAKELIPLLVFLSSDAASMMGGCLVPIDAGEGKAYLV